MPPMAYNEIGWKETSTRSGRASPRPANADWFDATFQTIKNCSAFSSVSAAASQPSITKSFAPSTIPINGISTLTITIDNTQAGAIALSALALNDVFPADVVIAATPNESTTCTTGTVIATAAANNIDLSGASLGAGSSCSFQADVTAPSAGAKANQPSRPRLSITPRAWMPPPMPMTP